MNKQLIGGKSEHMDETGARMKKKNTSRWHATHNNSQHSTRKCLCVVFFQAGYAFFYLFDHIFFYSVVSLFFKLILLLFFRTWVWWFQYFPSNCFSFIIIPASSLIRYFTANSCDKVWGRIEDIKQQFEISSWNEQMKGTTRNYNVP